MNTYYVSKTGTVKGDGSAGSPFRTIGQAIKHLKPGDEVVVKPGTYKEAVVVNRGGAAGKTITIRSEEPGGAKIIPTGNKAGITVISDYVKIEGFDVSGSNGAGITVSSAHHVEVVKNIVHDNVCDGIFLGKIDYATVEGNVVYRNAAEGPASGIHLKGAFNHTGTPDNGDYRIIVRGNVSYDNKRKYGPASDGNGISIDDFNNTQIPSRPPYAFKTLVDNNIVYGNTGRGVQIPWSDHVTVSNNLSYGNNADGRSGPWLGELVNMASSDTTWVGNIAITDAGNPAIINVSFKVDPKNTGVSYADNVTFNGKPGDASVFVNSGNTKPAAESNQLGKDPGLTLSDLKALAARLLADGKFAIPKIVD